MENITTSEKMSMTKVRELRRELGLSVSQFAKLIGSNTCSVYYWEQGKTNPRYSKIWDRIYALQKLFKKIRENPDYLLK